ncbi:MAG TPA: hypothetical protein VIF43_00395 [Patescibacteria group bacterium]|jgi:hypothetical protein
MPGPDQGPDPSGASGASTPPPPPPHPIDPEPAGGGRNLKLIVMSVVGLVLLAAAAVAAYALVGLGGNTTPEAPEFTPPAEATPSPSASVGLDPGQQVATLKPDGDVDPDASGEAARSTAAGRFVLAVSAELPDPPAGTFYEAFLINPDTRSEFSAGRLLKIDDRWVMTLDQARDASAYSKVAVTQESKDDGTPEKTILSGEF